LRLFAGFKFRCGRGIEKKSDQVSPLRLTIRLRRWSR
jgi:hypothetical protein